VSAPGLSFSYAFKRLRRTVRFFCLVAFAFLVSQLPLPFAQALGRATGRLIGIIARGERRKVLGNLQRAFPSSSEAERFKLARDCFSHLGQLLFELACVRHLDNDMPRFVRWPDTSRQVLERALARGNGVVFVSGHVGHWELLARRVASAGFDCQSIAKETSDPRLTRWIESFRASAGLRSIWRGQPGAAKHMLRALKSNAVLGLLIDQDTKVQSLFVDFFGIPAKTPRAAADLALKTGAALVVGFCQRQGDGAYEISMQEVSTETSTAQALTQTLTGHIESAIRKHPEQWVWMHQRWKSQP
jgi:Kdo2-lipid IVA lauroyltransferase/acyltransferase